jgi:hypothetical protein
VGVAQVLEEPRIMGENHERVRQVATDEIDAERRLLRGVGQPRQSLHRLLEEIDRVDKRRAGSGISSGLPEVGNGLVPRLPPYRVMGQPLCPLTEAAGVMVLHGGDDGGMKQPTATVEEATVSDLVGQGVLERVFDVREQARFVEELGGLEPGEAVTSHAGPPRALIGTVR